MRARSVQATRAAAVAIFVQANPRVQRLGNQQGYGGGRTHGGGDVAAPARGGPHGHVRQLPPLPTLGHRRPGLAWPHLGLILQNGTKLGLHDELDKKKLRDNA